jgi:hypothetical protein
MYLIVVVVVAAAAAVVVVTCAVTTFVWLYYELYFSRTIQTIHQSLREFPFPYIFCELRLIPHRETCLFVG